jgi:hypothetical protein
MSDYAKTPIGQAVIAAAGFEFGAPWPEKSKNPLKRGK